MSMGNLASVLKVCPRMRGLTVYFKTHCASDNATSECEQRPKSDIRNSKNSRNNNDHM